MTNRKERIKEFLNRKRIDGIIILKDENIYYMTGFYGKDSGSALLITKKKTYLFVNFIFLEDATKNKKESCIEIIQYRGDRKNEILKIVKKLGIKKLGFESHAITFDEYKKLLQKSSKVGIRLVDVAGLVESLRIVKDDSEIDKLKVSCEITDKVFNKTIDLSAAELRSFTERRLGIEMEKISLDMGSGFSSFDFVIASNQSSSLPHYIPQDKTIDEGVLLLDFGFKYKYYCSDMTRTVFIGKSDISKELKKIYKIVLAAQEKAIESCKEGILCKELDNIARELIEKEGYGDNYGHNLGHGVGLEVHEKPFVSKENDTMLKENMVITIEPGIYIEGLGGVRIEDIVIVKKDGCENLFKGKKRFTIID